MDKRALTVVGSTLYVVLASPPTATAGWSLLIAQTWTGRGLALLVLLLVSLPLLTALAIRSRGQTAVWGRSALACGVVAVGIAGAIFVTVPDGHAPDDAHVQSRFAGGTERLARFSLTNVIPEIEQINVGLALIPHLDSFIDRQQARRLASFILPAYQEMEADPEFHQLGSVMGRAYAEVLGQPFAAGHYYLYIPRNRAPGPLPAILFLHGSAGNFKVYTWAWSRFAEEHGYAIISPSYGFGNWYRAGGIQAAERALSDVETVVPLDVSRIYLAGLSNGGTGVSRAALDIPDRFRGLIYISGVIEPSVVTSDAFLEGWEGKPVLVVHGEADRRIPVAGVRSTVGKMEAGGIAVSYVEYPDEDHFLFLARLDEVLDNVAGWLE